MRSLLVISALGALGLGGAALRPASAPAVPVDRTAPIAQAVPSAAPTDAAFQDVVMTACLAPAERDLSLGEVPMARRRALAACVIRMLAPKMNEGLPARIDPITTLVAVRGEDTTMTYRYRLDLTAADLNPQIRASLERQVRADFCAAGAIRPVSAFGGAVRFDYVDGVGRQLMAIDISRC
ncbi:MAG TPA: hypothetical protein VGB08_02035 [Allosphingosinicella sp.]|jgi:hypothetical protein